MIDGTPTPNQRFNALWQAASKDGKSSLIAVVDRPYVPGSLGFETKSLGGIVADQVVEVRNVDVAGRNVNEDTISSLAALETLVEL